MIITQQDRDAYTKLNTLHNQLYQSLGKIKKIVNEEQVYTVLYQAAKRLVGRKDMLWMDSAGRIVPKEDATIKLSFAGFMKRDRWQRSWSRVREYDMWNYIFKEELVAGLEKHTTKRNPEAYQELVSILKDGLKLKEIKDEGLEVRTKLKLPKTEEVQAGLAGDETRLELVKAFTVSELELLSIAGWGISVSLMCYTPDGKTHQLSDLLRQDLFWRLSSSPLLDAIFVMMGDAKKYVDQQYEKRMEPQREFNKRYGHYLVAKEL